MNKQLNVDELEQLMGEEPIDWRALIEKYLSYWKWIVVSVLLALVIGAFYYRTQYNEYQVKSTLLITDKNSNQMSEMSILKQLDSYGMSTSSSNIHNENKVLQSKELIKKVVYELKLYTQYSKISYLKPIDLYIESPIEVIMADEDLLQITKPLTLSVEYQNGSYTIVGDYLHDEFTFKVSELPATLNTPAGNIQLSLSSGVTQLEDEIFVKISNPIRVVKAYQGGALTTEVPKDGDLVNITFRTNNIQKGKDFLQSLINTYNQDAIDLVNQSARFTATFIDGRLELLTGELSVVEKDIQTYKQSNELTNIEADATIILQRSNVYDQQANEIEIQLQLIKYVGDFLKDPAQKYALVPNLGLTDVGLVAVIQEYNKLLVSRERIATGSSANNPGLITLEAQINSTRTAIQNSIASSQKGLQISRQEMESQNAFLMSQLKKIPQQEREFIEIKRQQQIKESLYLFLLQKREEASLSMAITVPKGRLLDAADTADLLSPKLSMTMMIALMLGLIIPLGFLYLKFLLTNTLNERKDVEALTKVPIIAELSHQKTEAAIIDHSTNANANSELLRLLRSKLQFILTNPDERVVLVTSTVTGEGKTFVAVNLAVSLSLTEKKVLLIGMDLRKPMVAKIFNILEQEGASSYLSGMEADYHQLIHQVPEFPYLSVMAGGIIPPNPNELILSERLDTMIAEAKKVYDYIIIDTAPVGAVSDTFLINRLSNISLYVFRANYSDKRNLEYLNRIHRENTLGHLYIVLNDVDFELNRYGMRYSNGYGYGYGYGYGKKKAKK